MCYSKLKLLNYVAFAAATATCAHAVSIVEFTFNDTNIDETAGFAPSSIDSNVAMTTAANTNFFAGSGLTIQKEFTNLGMIPGAGAGYSGTSVTPNGGIPTPTTPAGSLNYSGIGQFTLLSTPTPDANAPSGYYVQPTSFRITGTGSNLSGIILQDFINDETVFVSTGTPNGAFDLTFDISSFDFFGFSHGPKSGSYIMYLVGANSASTVSATFAGGDVATFEGDLLVIPEPSTYLAGATFIGLGAFLVYRRRKQNATQEEEAK